MTAKIDPTGICQRHLDAVSNHLLLGQIEACAPYFNLPVAIRTLQDECIVETREDLLRDLSRFAQTLAGYETTHYVRLVKSARAINEDVIEAWYETHILRNANQVMPRYLSKMVLRRVGNEWRVIEAEHALHNSSLTMSFIKPTKDHEIREGKFDPPIDMRATNASAEPIYRAYLEGLDAATNGRKFDRWVTYFDFPYQAHYDETDHTVENPEQTRIFFDLQLEELDKAPDAVLTRTASSAQFIAADRIVGYHEANMTSGDTVIFGPVKCRMILRLADDNWVATSVTNSLAHQDLLPDAFEVSPYLPTMREIQERMRK